MNRGFTLFEMIIYISLLMILLIGIISSVFDFIQINKKKDNFSEENYSLLIKSFYE